MVRIGSCLSGARLRAWEVGLSVLVTCVVFGRSTASPPQDPLPPPYYSFDTASPKSVAGIVNPDAVLELDHPDPQIVVPGAALGLGAVGDELDAMSTDNSDLGPDDSFALLFSVTRPTIGVAPPDPSLVARQVPYNATDQAARGQAAGDQYMSTVLCTRTTGCTLNGRDLTPNSVLLRNNYNEGGTDYAAGPPTSAEETAAKADQDNVDATSDLGTSLRNRQILNVYFSAHATSPSLGPLSGDAGLSGANIFFNADPLGPAGDTVVYAAFSDLALQPGDDIDAMIVFDLGADGVFDVGIDQILFSLAPASPSLQQIPGASSSGAAADIFLVTAGMSPELFVSAAELGLGEDSDDIDALDFLLCDDAETCAVAHGIRRLLGDFDNDGDVDLDDRIAFESCFTGPGGPVSEGCERGDFDGDNDIDCLDWAGFIEAWTEPGDPPPLPQCPGPIPTVSEWGIIATAVLFLVVGGYVIGRARRRTLQ